MSVKALFHIDEPEKWTLLVQNVRNLIQALEGRDRDVEILANSSAVAELAGAGSGRIPGIEELAAADVRLAACRNSLKALRIPESALPGYVVVVPVGVLEIIDRQAEGFAYIKP